MYTDMYARIWRAEIQPTLRLCDKQVQCSSSRKINGFVEWYAAHLKKVKFE